MLREPLRGRIRTRDGEIEYQHKQKEHQRDAHAAAGDQPVHGALPFQAARVRVADGLGGDFVRPAVNRGNHRIAPCIFIVSCRQQGRTFFSGLPQRLLGHAQLGLRPLPKRFAAIEQPHGEIAAVEASPIQPRGHSVHRARNRRGISNRRRKPGQRAGARAAEQFLHALVAPRAGTYDRHAQQRFQPPQIDGNAAAPRLIEQIDAHHHALAGFQRLQRQVQIARQTRRIANGHDNVHSLEQQKIARKLFFPGMCHERIRAGQIHHAHAPIRLCHALRQFHRLPRPVARMLLKAGHPIEQRALAHIGVACERDHPVRFRPAHAIPPEKCSLHSPAGAPPARPARDRRACRPMGLKIHSAPARLA